jgi:ribosomal-protein-alanine N-acetyltransferase
MINSIQTRRLKMIALTAGQLKKYLEASSELESELGLKISYDSNDEPVRNAIGIKLGKMAQESESKHPWLTYWLMIVEEDAFGAGLIGFKGLPDQDGKTEVGFKMTHEERDSIFWRIERPAEQR